jgi:hypothetical protein
MVFGDQYSQIFFDEKGRMQTWAKWGIGGGLFLVSLGILFSVLGIWDEYITPIWDSITEWDFATIIIIIGIIAVLFWVSKDSTSKKEESKSDKK